MNALPETELPLRPCVGVMLVNDAGLIFTGERIDTPNAWQMPQGGIDEGEDPEAAALRELEEEIGVPANKVSVLAQTNDWIPYILPAHLQGKVWNGRYSGQKQLWFKMRLLEPTAIDIATAHPEFSRWKWSSPDEVLEEIVDFKRSVYKEILSELY